MKKKNLSFPVLFGIVLLTFCAASLSMAAPADSDGSILMARPEVDFHDSASKQEPAVQTTSGETHQLAGESVENDKMSRPGADFHNSASQQEPVVQTTSGETRQLAGESVENDKMSRPGADFK